MGLGQIFSLDPAMSWLVAGCHNGESTPWAAIMSVLCALVDTTSKGTPVQVPHSFAASSAVFDDAHLVSCAGLVAVMTLATQTGLSQLLVDKVRISDPRIKSALMTSTWSVSAV